MDRHGAGHPQGGGDLLYHGVGNPQGRGEVNQKCGRCFKMGRGPNGGCNWGLQPEEMRGDSADSERNPGLGPCCSHAGVGNLHGQTGNRIISKYEVEFLDRLQELELQVRMIRSENLEHKKILTRLYNLAYATHSEVKAQNQSIAEKVEHLEETLGLVYPQKARKHKVFSSDLEDINRKMEKLQKFMANAGNFVDLKTEKNGVANSTGATMDIGLQ